MTLPPWAVEFLRGALAAPGHKALLCCGRKNAKSAYGSTGPEISSHRASSRPGPGIPTTRVVGQVEEAIATLPASIASAISGTLPSADDLEEGAEGLLERLPD